MKLTPKIQKAIDVSAQKHLGQARKAVNLPYIVHPFSVAWILSNYTNDEDIIAAGLLHDVLEDVPGYGFDGLKKDFGEKIAGIVKEVSEDKDPNIKTDSKATWDYRKNKYINHLNGASREAMLVCAADKIHNLSSILEAHNKYGSDMWKSFNAPVEKKLNYYEQVLKILKKRLKNKIVKELEKTYLRVKGVLEVK